MQRVSPSVCLLLTATVVLACSDPKPPATPAQPAHVLPETITIPRTYLTQSREIPLEFKLGDETLSDAHLTLLPDDSPEGAFMQIPEGPLHIPARLKYAPVHEGTDRARILIEWKEQFFLVDVSAQAVAVPLCEPPDICLQAQFDFETEICLYKPDNEGKRCRNELCPDFGVCFAGVCRTVSATPTPPGRCDANPEAEVSLSPAWTFSFGKSWPSRLALDDAGNLYLYGDDPGGHDEVLSFTVDGELRWRQPVNLNSAARLFVSGESVALSTATEIQVRSSADGSLLWKDSFGASSALVFETMLAPDTVLVRQLLGGRTSLQARNIATGMILQQVDAPPFATGEMFRSAGVFGDGTGKAIVSLSAYDNASHWETLELAVDGSLQTLWSKSRTAAVSHNWQPLLVVGDTYWNQSNEVFSTSSGEPLGTVDWPRTAVRAFPIEGGDGDVYHVRLETYDSPTLNGSSGLRCSSNTLYVTDPLSRDIIGACTLQTDGPPAILGTKEGIAVVDVSFGQQVQLLRLHGPGEPRLIAHLLPDGATLLSNVGLAAHGQRAFMALTINNDHWLSAYDIPELEVAPRGWISEDGNLSRTSTPRLTSRADASK